MAGQSTHVHVGGDVVGQLIVGDHNIMVWAQQSVVTVVPPADRPQPVRRTPITLLPRRTPRPVGRDRELVALREMLTNGRLGQVFGRSGMGKSTLLRYAARQLAQPGAEIVYLSAAGRTVGDVLQDIFETCFDSVGYHPSPLELRRHMSGIDVTLLVDDLDLPADQQEALLDAVPDASIAFTSTQRSLWAHGQSWELIGLAWDASLALLTATLNRRLAEPELRAAHSLWQATGGSPLLLLRAAASARVGPNGVLVLPHAAELQELLPQILASLDDAAREVVAVLAVANCAVSADLMRWLVLAPTALPAVASNLTTRGVAIRSEQGLELAPGVAARLPVQLFPGLRQLIWLADRLQQSCRQLPPWQLANHLPLLTGVIHATVRFGRPDVGAFLAKTAAPVVACSGRLDAWERLLTRGRAAAQLAGDRATLAYLVHEYGIHSLVTGKRAAAAAAVAAAAGLWHELGDTALETVAQQTQSMIGTVTGGQIGGIPTVAPTATPADFPNPSPTASGPQPLTVETASSQASGHAASAAPTSTTGAAVTSTKAGLGLAAKVAIAGIATVAVAGGGTLLVNQLTTSRPSAASSSQTAQPAQTSATTQAGTTEPSAPTPTKERSVMPTDCPTDSFWGRFLDASSHGQTPAKSSVVGTSVRACHCWRSLSMTALWQPLPARARYQSTARKTRG